MTTALPPRQFTTVDGHRLAHVEMGQGEPIVLLHGNPTSKFLWRALCFHWARLHPQQVRGIAYMETIVMPLRSRTAAT